MEGDRPVSARIDWLDIAKAYGVFLVYYGQLVEAVSEMGNEAALVQQKLIYAFHMPLFILLSAWPGPSYPVCGPSSSGSWPRVFCPSSSCRC